MDDIIKYMREIRGIVFDHTDSFYLNVLVWKPGFQIKREVSDHVTIYVFDKNVLNWKTNEELEYLKKKYGWNRTRVL